MLKNKNVTIIIPTHNPDQGILCKIEKMISIQDYDGNIKTIKATGMGLAEGINYGVGQAKTEIVITLHQDCVPSSENWLKNLVKPLENDDVVCTVSKVELPKSFWKKFGFFARIMSAKEQKVITPAMDEKGCAFKKSILEKIGGFDSKIFRTAGEDVDMYFKLDKLGKFSYPDSKVIHFHSHTFKNRLKKEYQLSEGSGVLFRVYGRKDPIWRMWVIKSIPILGWPTYWFNFPYRRMFFGGVIWIFLSLIINFIYSVGFWKGFLSGRQRI